MNGRRIVVTVRPDGKVEVRAEGYQGPACVADVRRIAEALGITLEEAHLPEYYASAEVTGEGWIEVEG